MYRYGRNLPACYVNVYINKLHIHIYCLHVYSCLRWLYINRVQVYNCLWRLYISPVQVHIYCVHIYSFHVHVYRGKGEVQSRHLISRRLSQYQQVIFPQVFNNVWLIWNNVVICLCKKFVIMQKLFTSGNKRIYK